MITRFFLIVMCLCFSSIVFSQTFIQPRELSEADACTSPLERKIVKTIDNIGLNINFDLVQVLFHGVSDFLSSGYQLEIGPSFAGKLYTREDHYYFELGHNFELGKLTHGLPIFFELNAESRLEFEFDRQFEDPCLANKFETRYGQGEIPFKSSVAIEKLKIGDYFTMKSHWGLAPGIGISQGIILTLSAGVHQMIFGDFQFHFLKLSESKVQIKLVASQEVGESLTPINISLFKNLKLSSIGAVNSNFHRMFESILDISYVKAAHKVSIYEMIVDLSNKQAREAYDQMLNFSLDNQDVMRDMVSLESLKNVNFDLRLDIASTLKPAIFINIEALQKLAQEHSPFVNETFKGLDAITSSRKPKKVGMSLIEGGRGISETEDHKISVIGTNNQIQNYQVRSFHSRSELRSQANLQGETSDQSTHLLNSTNEGFKTKDYLEFVSSTEIRKKKFGPKDFAQFKAVLERNIPNNIYSNMAIDFNRAWTGSKQDHLNTHALIQIAFHKSAFQMLPLLDEAQLSLAYEHFLELINLEAVESFKSFLTSQSKSKLSKLVHLLAIALDTEKIMGERLNAFAELEKIPLFVQTGSGFLISILPKESLAKLVKVDFLIEDAEGNKSSSSFGDFEIDPLYLEVLKIQNLVNDSGKDIKLEGIRLTLKLAKDRLNNTFIEP